MNEPAEPNTHTRPLCVDLDGTLLAVDSMQHSIKLMLQRRPWMIVMLSVWYVTGGLVHLKRQIARRITLDPRMLPWRQEVVDFVRQQHAAGRYTVLASASHLAVVQRMADYLGCFDRVIATDKGENLRGSAKVRAIRTQLRTETYDYIGDSRMDLPVWREATEAMLVHPRPRVRREAERVGNVVRVFGD